MILGAIAARASSIACLPTFLGMSSSNTKPRVSPSFSTGFQFPDDGPLEAAEFGGGYMTVQLKLKELGFVMRVG
jgi:hypothetical protein